MLTSDRVPDDEGVKGLHFDDVGTVSIAKKDKAVAGVESSPTMVVGTGKAGGGQGRDEAGGGGAKDVADEAQHGGSGAVEVELAEAAAEASAGDEAAPWLADEGGADEARRVVRREAEEHIFHELLHQHPRHRACWLVGVGVGELDRRPDGQIGTRSRSRAVNWPRTCYLNGTEGEEAQGTEQPDSKSHASALSPGQLNLLLFLMFCASPQISRSFIFYFSFFLFEKEPRQLCTE